MARFGSVDRALAAVSVELIGQITIQIHVQKVTAVMSQASAGAYAQFQNAPASTNAMTPSDAETPSLKLVRDASEPCRSIRRSHSAGGWLVIGRPGTPSADLTCRRG
jgi:hypothetical protein